MFNGNAQLTSFMADKNTEYELKLDLEDNTPIQKKIKINVATNVPGPSYDLMFEREFKWIEWTIVGLIIFITLITGFFGFRKKASR